MAHLGSDAFWGCSNLTEITCKSQNPPVTLYKDQVGLDRPSGVFYGVDKQNCKLYIPQECVEAYRAAELWRDFNIIEMGTGISEVKNERVKSEKYDNTLYDLQGRKVIGAEANCHFVLAFRSRPLRRSSLFTLHSSLKKGLYIVNGRKVAVK